MATTLGVSLDDRALAVARDGAVLSVAPGIVRRAGAGAIGSAAADSLRRRPAEVSARHWNEIAAESAAAAAALPIAAAELRARLQGAADAAAPEAAWFAVSAAFTPRALSGVLGVAQSLALPVRGFVDAAVAAVAPLGLGRPALVLEIGLYHTAVTAVECGATVRRRRSIVSRAGGLLDLYQSWLDVVSAAMVLRTRFDPLHDAAVEQRLFDTVPALSAEAEAGGVASVALDGPAGERHEVEVTRDQLAAAAAPRYRELERCVHELRRAGTPVALVAPEALLALAGLRERLDGLADCELIAVPDGWAAAVVSQLPAEAAPGDAPVRLLRRLDATTTRPEGDAPRHERLGAQRNGAADPTHVLYAGRALPLTARGLTVGRDGNGSDITLPPGSAGVSRRHCTLLRGREGVELIDHSRHGSRVNDERVFGRTLLHAGDRLRVGEPGIELALIAVGADSAQAPSD